MGYKIFWSSLLSCLILSWNLSGYVYLSGPDKARLVVDSDHPKIVFEWDGKYPKFTDIAAFQNGKFVGFTAKEIMEQAMLLAIKQWTSVPASYLEIELVESSNLTVNEKDLKHVITVSSSGNLSTAAFAIPTIEKGQIVDCDITIVNRKVSITSFLQTVIHEMGHCIGLGHAHSDYKAIMGYSRTDNSFELGADDLAGLISLYPHPDFVSPSGVSYCGSITQGSKSSHSDFAWILLFLPFLFSLLPLRTRKP